MAAPTNDEIQRIINHIFLPPKLPQREDESSDISLVCATLDALTALRDKVLPGCLPVPIANAISAVSYVKQINSLSGGKTDETELHRVLTTLPITHTLAVKISSQNAAVLATRDQDSLIFEIFELSPQNQDVITTKGRLIRTFPANAIAVRASVLEQADCTSMIAHTLSTMCHQAVDGMQPQSKKTKRNHDEKRDTAVPAMVSELFFGMLKGIGEPFPASTITKKMRDEVLFDSAKAPWRRSPMWLLIRVTLQLVLTRSAGGSPHLYKLVMLSIMSHVLDVAKEMTLDTEMLYIMNAKIGRRLQKLSITSIDTVSESITHSVANVARGTADLISRRWESVQQLDTPGLDLPVLATLDFERDSIVDISALSKYIEGLSHRQHEIQSSTFTPTSELIEFADKGLPQLPHALPRDAYYAAACLQSFERWVALHLSTWQDNYTSPDACEKLDMLLARYHNLACGYYSDNPEAKSITVLTYNPGIPSDVLQNLLLPFAEQMQRLSKLEAYLDGRATRSVYQTESLFDTQDAEGFSAQFYDSSDQHKALFSVIEADAMVARQQKLEEFQRTLSEYHRLDALYTLAEHYEETRVVDFWCDPPETRQEHVESKCLKCYYGTQREALSIHVHEWPLPESAVEAKAVVFELQVPSWIAFWRSSRFYLCQDVLKGTRPAANLRSEYKLESNDPHLTNQYFKQQGARRIGLLSENKPLSVTHYRSKGIANLDQSNVCVDNGLWYQYYDNVSDWYVGRLVFPDDVPRACTYSLSHPALQKYIVRPASAPDGVAPNAVIASQDSCPANMTLQEFAELSTIPLGRHIQWSNIILQLAMPGVDFKKTDTALVILQCIYQVGPPTDTYADLREAHNVFNDDVKAALMVEHLSAALQRIKENWESAQALSTFIAIAARIVSLSQYAARSSLAFLDSARQVSASWIQSLRDKVHAATDHEDRTTFTNKAVEVALICVSTFDVDQRHLEGILEVSSNVSVLVQASVVVQEGEHTQSAAENARLSLLGLRFKRLLFRSYKLLANNTAGIDDAIKKSWASYVPGGHGWAIVSNKASNWLTTEISGTEGVKMRVHYNLLNGELLVNGLPLDQPPKSYRHHPLFSTLFGKAAIEVMPSPNPGFQFSTKRRFEGYEVQLNMHYEELIVQAKCGETIWETVRKGLLEEVYPSHFVQDYVHWYDYDTHTVAFLPTEDPWNRSSLAQWRLIQSRDCPGWRLTKDGSSLLGLRSQSSKAISRILSPLVDESNVHNIVQPRGSKLQVNVPHLRLGFLLSRGSCLLQSKEFRSMEVDSDQFLGTFVGFYNKLVLRSKTRKRMVLILESNVTYGRQGAHVVVSASKRTEAKVHALGVDDLGRLLDNGDLGCKLYVAYLHALSSFCLPDPLTHKTGTEQALSILGSAAVRSFEQLSEDSVLLLGRIAQLSPGRRYYPADMRVMQTVDWDHRLSVLSQHARLHIRVREIFNQAQESQIFYPDTSLEFPPLQAMDEDLQERDSIRSSVFRISGFGAEDHTMVHDQRYSSRDRGSKSQQSLNSAFMAGLMIREDVELHWKPQAVGDFWRLMCTVDQVHGYHLPIEYQKLRYNAKVVEDGLDYAVSRLPALLRWMNVAPNVEQHKFSIIMWLSTMAFSKDVAMSDLQAIAMLPKLGMDFHPKTSTIAAFQPQVGTICTRAVLKDIVDGNRRGFRSYPEYPEYRIARQTNERQGSYISRRNEACQRAEAAAVTKLTDAIFNQWPGERVRTPAFNILPYIDVNAVIEAAGTMFERWCDNARLQSDVTRIERVIGNLGIDQVRLPDPTVQSSPTPVSLPAFTSETDLFSRTPPQLPETCHVLQLPERRARGSASQAHTGLGSLVQRLEASAGQSKYEQEYVDDLKRSSHALASRDTNQFPIIDSHPSAFLQHEDDCRRHAQKIYDLLRTAVSPNPTSSTAPSAHQWPRVSRLLFLQQLSRGRWHTLSADWKSRVVQFALALTAVQRAERLVHLSKSPCGEDLVNELRNSGHQNWDAMNYPESLLIEVESGIIIRDVQEQVAGQMRQPVSDRNSVMQLNMGEGKSSLIVPIVVVSMADGSQLVRVIVGKPQSKQMAQMLISKLGGLVDRRVYYMPFSRSLKLDRAAADRVARLLEECKSNGGVLLVQPEHILSFQLMAPECYITGRESVGRSLRSTQDFLDMYSRDIVDESDENFSVRFELIYTMGMQRAIELSPHRWLLLQQILDLVRQVAPAIAQELPLSLEVIPGVAGSFPRVRILRSDAEAALMRTVAHRVCADGLNGFRISHQPDEVRRAVFTYITQFDLDVDETNAVEKGVLWTETTRSPLLLLRGIIAGGVLAFTLGQKRWRVDYGRASRTPPTKLAVPYRAKDSPSPRSEFSHPDVLSTLTSLCYYYDGLSDEDLFVALGHLMDSDQADIEYQAWVKDAHGLSATFKQLQGINLKDRPHCVSTLFPALRYGKNVVDYFLSHHVFPKEMKEFPHKLSASGWDLGKSKERLTTGFSGTNDSRRLLPVDVGHLDLEQQKHTNALVLEYLLQPENSVRLMTHAAQYLSDGANLLETVSRLDPPVDVILDVGAQILELNNSEVATTWLQMYNSTKDAAVFVNDVDELCVVDRHGRTDLLQTSSFATRLDSCLIFLDEAHTRGIDLKLPVTYRAALTLGANLTKDRLVQAAMRMRKLGKGQTVVFAIPKEIQVKILECTSKTEATEITVEDVLFWSIAETHTEVRRSMPLWAVQGERFVRQEALWKAVRRGGKTTLSQEHSERFQEGEAQSLNERYRPRPSSSQPAHFTDSTDPDMKRIADRCAEFDGLQFTSSTLQEQQERELSPEIEQERQVQRAPPADPARHSMHPDVRTFATTGALVSRSTAYMPAFHAMRDSSAAQDTSFEVSQLGHGRQLWVTADFVRTVIRTGGSFVSDAFQRPVQWLLTNRLHGSSTIDCILIVSPYEANQLSPSMKTVRSTALHIYKPRCNSGYRALDNLDFDTVSAQAVPPMVPRALAVQLDLFAGQLYISSYEDYLKICKFLGLSTRELTSKMRMQGWELDANGFIVRDEQGRTGGESSLNQSPVNFFKILMSNIRRYGNSISKTQMGSLLEGKRFGESDWADEDGMRSGRHVGKSD